jgi:serine/threonine-protein kinase
MGVAEEPNGRSRNEEPGGTALNVAVDATAPSSGAAVDPFIGLVLLRYRVDERLASGGMGVLYRATDLKLGRRVAIKLLSPQLAANAVAKGRFEREARAASALDHPNIATVHDIGEERGELFIVMALYEGETLEQRLTRGAVPVDEAVVILKQVALGLEAAHRAGIVHRDIKPPNVLVTTDGVAKILDFGVAKLKADALQGMTEVGQTVGTALYMSPEQLRGHAVDERSDLWSLGVLGYELLSGISPL